MAIVRTILLLAAFGLTGGPMTAGQAAEPTTGFGAEVVFQHVEHPSSNYRGTLAAGTAPAAIRFRIDIGTDAEGEFAFEVIVNRATQKSWVLESARRRFYELPYELGLVAARLLTGLVDDAPCWEYRQAKRLGPDKVDGRPVVKWRCAGPKGSFVAEAETRWHDPALGAVVLSEDDEGGQLRLRRIVKGAQPARLFLPPANYRRTATTPVAGMTELRQRLLSGRFSEDDVETLFALMMPWQGEP